MDSVGGIKGSTSVASGARDVLGSAQTVRLDSARKELEYRGHMVTPAALAARSGLSLDVAVHYLRSKGAATGPLPKTPLMRDFIAARAARAAVEQAVREVRLSLPAAYQAPPKPATDLLEQNPPRLRRRYPDVVAWERGIYKAIPAGVLLGVGPYLYLSTQGRETAIALAASALVAGVVIALPVMWNAVTNVFERRSVAKANAAIEATEDLQIEAYNAAREANAAAIKQQQADLDAWVAGNAAAADLRANSITAVHLDPIRKVLESVKDSNLRKQVAGVAKPILEELLSTRRGELSIGVAADAETWVALGRDANTASPGALLGFAIDHFDASNPKERYWAETSLAAIKDQSATAIADAYRARLFDRDAARAPGNVSEQILTLVMLKGHGSAV